MSDEQTPWKYPTAKNRIAPRECIMAAREALNRAYGQPYDGQGNPPWPLIMEAVDWQRRALEQMVEGHREGGR